MRSWYARIWPGNALNWSGASASASANCANNRRNRWISTAGVLPSVSFASDTVRHASKFSLGRLCITAAAAQVVSSQEVLQAVARHAAGDWGDLDTHDLAANEKALRNGGRLLSVYETNGGSRFYVITESDRQVTTLLLPEDY